MPRNLRHTLGRDGSGSRTHLPHAYPKVDHRRIQVVATPIEARQNALREWQLPREQMAARNLFQYATTFKNRVPQGRRAEKGLISLEASDS